ncbi:hypothetical protein IGS68_19175 [Skermanella sp. TT6]|uniref:Uncharacterized protein n=1 Tax=Skermanella cutis TaxID=2775420 RepID=A0ABX7B1H0_9PROT|nr:hypothetical protein [Skermanella sp. TT6]QQP88167.1 hypothetical protein IGS68_19175 [Skermanella sp. TT6]
MITQPKAKGPLASLTFNLRKVLQRMLQVAIDPGLPNDFQHSASVGVGLSSWRSCADFAYLRIEHGLPNGQSDDRDRQEDDGWPSQPGVRLPALRQLAGCDVGCN